jgi:hypothetical protein
MMAPCPRVRTAVLLLLLRSMLVVSPLRST